MAITKVITDIDQVGHALTAWFPVDKSDFVLVDTKVNGEAREAVYQRVTDSDDVNHPSSVRVGYYPKATTSNYSIKVTTWVKTEDSVTGEVVWEPISATLALTGPGRAGGLDATGSLYLLCNLFSWMWPAGGTAFTNAAIDLLKFGVVNTLNELAD